LQKILFAKMGHKEKALQKEMPKRNISPLASGDQRTCVGSRRLLKKAGENF